MPDMLVHLLKLPSLDPVLAEMRDKGVIVRRANSFEITAVREFIVTHFGNGWADEVLPCYSRQPISLYIAIREGKVIGFGAYEATRPTLFGPTGVAEAERGKGIGGALLIACLHGLRELGYPYGIIGGAGPVEFYSKIVGATIIENSVPGIYADMLKSDTEGG